MEPRRSLPGSASASAGLETASRNVELSTTPMASGRYTDKPLPPLPLNPASFVSSHSVEVTSPFKTPRPTPRRDEDDDAPFFFDWDVQGRSASAKYHVPSQTTEGSDRIRRRLSPKTVPRGPARPSKASQQEGWASVRWDQRRMLATNELAKPRERHTLPKVDIPGFIPSVPPDEILSPQPKQSVQKILRLTGNMSPMTTLSTDSPTLHNSSQKIKQLTGLDYGPRSPWAEDPVPLVEIEDDVSNVSTSGTASTYSNESLEGDNLSPEHAESVFSSSYVESMDEVYTQLTAPKYSTPLPIYRDSRSYSEPLVRDALRLSGFNATDSLARPPIERRESWFRDQDDSDKESLGASSDELSDVTELEGVIDKLFHPTTFSFVSTGPEAAFNSSPALGESSALPLLRPPRRNIWESNLPDDMAFAGHRNDFTTSSDSFNEQAMERCQATTIPPPSPVPSDSFSEHHLIPISNERGLSPQSVPLSPLPPPAPKDDRWLRPRPLDSPGLTTSTQETEASSARFSILTKILTSGSVGSTASNSTHNQRIATQSGCSTVCLGRVSGGEEEDIQQPTSAWSPDTPESGVTTFASAASSIIRRATDGGITTTTTTITTSTSAATTPATAGGGGISSSTARLDEESPKRLWKRALDHAKSKAGVRSRANRKRHK